MEGVAAAKLPTAKTQQCLQASQTVASEGAVRVAVFDWDDTLFPTSQYLARGLREPRDRAMLAATAALIEALWRKLWLMRVRVVIVTNAMRAWVYESAQAHYPSLTSLLGRVAVISARELYERSFPTDDMAWKRYTFRALLDALMPCRGSSPQMLSVGDSLAEWDAAHALTHVEPTARIATIKFHAAPSPDMLFAQLQDLHQNLLRGRWPHRIDRLAHPRASAVSPHARAPLISSRSRLAAARAAAHMWSRAANRLIPS